MKTAVIGVGNMGSRYASMILSGKIDGMQLCALTRFRDQYRELLQPAADRKIPVYQSADALFDDIDAGNLKLDAVIIATPHESHEVIAVKAMQRGIHVLCDKPAGVYSRQARNMIQSAEENQCVFGMIFNQRALPLNQKIHEIIQSGKYGSLKRVNWTVTDWYRPDQYYASGSWRATWKGEGGGVLLNQCPHNLDLLQWFCGMPVRIQAFCKEGHYHNIEVEDDATLYLEWENGACGTFVTSTADAPGINRLEISLEEALIRAENGKLMIGELGEELGMKEREYRRSADDCFRKIHGTWKEIVLPEADNPYITVLQSFADTVSGNGSLTASGSEGINSLLISNGAYLSSWTHRMINLPERQSEEEKLFENEFEFYLNEKRR